MCVRHQNKIAWTHFVIRSLGRNLLWPHQQELLLQHCRYIYYSAVHAKFLISHRSVFPYEKSAGDHVSAQHN